MACILYKDFSRGCIVKFKDLLKVSNYDVCQSQDGYKKCPFYRVIDEPDACCKYTEECINLCLNNTGGSVPYKSMVQVGESYCFSDNNVNCVVYKLREEGKDVPIDISPDDSKIEMEI
jgi:hypothetical protein